MLRPLLIIGAGGSGGKTLRSMRQGLERRLEVNNYKSGIPSAWQFLQIDTTYDGLEFPAPMLDRSTQVQLVVKPGDSHQDLLRRITGNATLSEQQDMLAGFGTLYTAVDPTLGAGQIRGLGKQYGISDASGILNQLRTAVAKLKDPAGIEELRRISRAIGASGVVDTPRAFIISSLGGGSGAGMFLDIAELLKQTDDAAWVKEAIAFLYTGEVFESLGKQGADIAKNTLGAMNEVMSGKWNGAGERTKRLLSHLGLPARPNSKPNEFGASANILIGTKNKSGTDISIGEDGAGQNEVFLTIGEALAAVVTDSTILEWLFQVAFVNIAQRKSALDKSGLAPDPLLSKELNPTFAAAGIGFGQLTLGSDRIVNYVTDALSQKQAQKLLWPALNSELLKDGITNQQLVEEKADQIWPTFLERTGLDERGSQDQIIEKLFPKNWEVDCKQFVNKTVNNGVTDKPLTLQNFARSVWNAWENDHSELLDSIQEEIKKQAREWVPSIQNVFREVAAEELTRSGFLVFSNLIERLQSELTNYSLKELRHEHEDFAKATKGFDQSKFNSYVQEVAEGITGVNKQNKQFLGRIEATFNKVLEFRVKSYVLDLASSLIEDLLANFLEPLLSTLSNARFNLQSQVSDQNNEFNKYPSWGSGIISKRYRNRTIERILIDPSAFESTFEFYAARDSKGAAPFTTSVNWSLVGKAMNEMPGDINEQTLVTVRTPWVTGVRDAQDQMGSAMTKVEWDFHTDLLELSKRNKEWLRDERSAFGQFTKVSIREYVTASGEKPDVKKAREDSFIGEFRRMIKMAEPLVAFNDRAFAHILSVSDVRPANGIIRKSSKIPFSPTSSVGRECTKIIDPEAEQSNDPGFNAAWFDESSTGTSMFAVSTTQGSLPPWAFSSLTTPILEQVAMSRTDQEAWNQFWAGRRTRPLLEAIPLEAEMRKSVMTGWFLSQVFGLVEKRDLPVGRTIEIWNPTLQVPGWSSFPSPLLATKPKDIEKTWWYLPQLLSSIGLALSKFGATGELEALFGYRLLKYIGREVTTSLERRDMWDGGGHGDTLPNGQVLQSTYLKNWINTEELPTSTRSLHKDLTEELSRTPDRKTALITVINKWNQEYEDNWKRLEIIEWHELPETWELRGDISMVFADIITYLGSMDSSSSDTGV